MHQLHEMLGDLADTREIVIEASSAGEADDHPLVLAWRFAARHAASAYAQWRDAGGADAYVSYRALADQADAAQDTLAASLGRLPRTT